MALVEVKVPDIGDFDEVTVIELMVKVGDTIKGEQSLITVESDKASMEIPSSTAGVVKELRVKLGDKVKQGSVVLVLEASGAVSAPVCVHTAETYPPAHRPSPSGLLFSTSSNPATGRTESREHRDSAARHRPCNQYCRASQSAKQDAVVHRWRVPH